jgi:predicted O-methyltransferase YrrM
MNLDVKKLYDDIIEKYKFNKTINEHIENIRMRIIYNSIKLEAGNIDIEGNCVYPKMLHEKILNLIRYSSDKNISKILEIGFNAGHSTLFMLLYKDLENPIKYTIFDICCRKYVKPCFDYIKSTFQNVDFNFIEGDSIKTMADYIEQNNNECETYDLIHVDGGHSYECIVNDFKNSTKLLKKNGILIVDDVNINYINDIVDQYINDKIYEEEVYCLKTYIYPHRILKKIV